MTTKFGEIRVQIGAGDGWTDVPGARSFTVRIVPANSVPLRRAVPCCEPPALERGAAYGRFAPCCGAEARPVRLGAWRCPACGAEHPDAAVEWRRV